MGRYGADVEWGADAVDGLKNKKRNKRYLFLFLLNHAKTIKLKLQLWTVILVQIYNHILDPQAFECKLIVKL